MANKKFSEFTLKTDSANVDFVVGYDGTDNVRIAPSNLGGGGASDLNGLSDAKTTSDALYVGTLPTGASGGGAGNTTLGKNAGVDLNTGSANVIVGNFAAGQAVNSTRSVAVGQYASFLPTNTYQYVIGIGWAASYNASDNYVIGIGDSTFYAASGGEGSIAIGSNALRSCTADRIIAIGYQAAYSQTSGSGNTVIGERAAYSNTTGENNTSVGDETAYSSTGSKNTSVGKGAFGGGFGHSGSDNVAIGYLANQQPSGASNYNVAIGSEALRSSGTRSENVAIGYKAGTAVTTGGRCVIIGSEAGNGLTTSIRTVIIGHDAAQGITTNGWDSVHIGDSAGKNVTGQKNTSVGKDAMLKASGTSDNSECTAIGQRALRALQTGNQNTALGASAGDEITTGSNCTILGYHAQASSASASNEITLGDTNIATLRCAVTSITSLSDERDKTDINDLSYGLDFVNNLQPREFVWDNRAETRTNTDIDGNETEVEFYSANKGKKDFGFIAQEVQALDNDTLRLVYDENPEKLELSYGKLVPVLVKAIQDLSAKVTALENA